MDVEEDGVRRFAGQEIVGRFGAAGADHTNAVVRQGPLEHPAQGCLVIDDENGAGHHADETEA